MGPRCLDVFCVLLIIKLEPLPLIWGEGEVLVIEYFALQSCLGFMHLVSIGDLIDLEPNFDLNRDQINFFDPNLKPDFYSSQ